MYNQLVTPNLNITYTGGYCEKAAENTVGQDGVYGSAYKAWKANVQHKENPPKGFYVPIYLDMPNGPKDPDGTQQDDVAISCPDGTVAAAAQSGTHKPLFKYSSLQAYISDYSKNNGGATLRGWGEYIGKIQVIKGGDVPKPADKGNVEVLFEAVYNMSPAQSDIDFWLATQLDFQSMFYAMKDSDRYKEQAFINNGDIEKLKDHGIDASKAKSMFWKAGMRDFATGIDGEFVPVGNLYIKKGK